MEQKTIKRGGFGLMDIKEAIEFVESQLGYFNNPDLAMDKEDTKNYKIMKDIIILLRRRKAMDSKEMSLPELNHKIKYLSEEVKKIDKIFCITVDDNNFFRDLVDVIEEIFALAEFNLMNKVDIHDEEYRQRL